MPDQIQTQDCRSPSADRIRRIAIGIIGRGPAKNRVHVLIGHLHTPVVLREFVSPSGYQNVSIDSVKVDDTETLLGQVQSTAFTIPSLFGQVVGGLIATKRLSVTAQRWRLTGHGTPVVSISRNGNTNVVKIKFRLLGGAHTASRRKPLQFAFIAETIS